MHPFDPIKALSKKFSSWTSEQEAQMFAARAKHLINAVHAHVPPCVLYCLINTWWNGWCTNRRFQGNGRCRLSESCEGDDSLEHYAECASHWEVFAKKLRKPIGQSSIFRFFGLDVTGIDDMIFHVCHIYAVKRAVDIRRRTREDLRGGAEELEALIWHGHRTAALYHGGLAKRYSQIWHGDLA